MSDTPAGNGRVRPYEAAGAEAVSEDGLEERSETVVRTSLVTPAGKVRHDSERLADVLLGLLGIENRCTSGEAGTGDYLRTNII